MLATNLAESLTELALPTYFLHGVYDYTCSYTLAKSYFEQLKAPLKGFYTFERSAHSPIFEEPQKAAKILRDDILAGTNDLADQAPGGGGMCQPMIAVVGTLVGLVGLGAAVTAVGRIVYQRQMASEMDALLSDARPTAPSDVSERDLQIVPEPVRRWLRYSQVVERERPTTVRLRQKGQFQMDRTGWLPYEAEQYFTTDPPAFLWKASFRMLPLVSVVGRDQYRNGEASIQMRILSLLPVADKTGGGLNQGDLLRYLGELQWFPAAALADYLTWEGLGADSARATIRYGGITASMTFFFGDDGRLLEARAIRYNDARGRNERWVNRNDSDLEFGGIRVPAVGEARWEYDSGPMAGLCMAGTVAVITGLGMTRLLLPPIMINDQTRAGSRRSAASISLRSQHMSATNIATSGALAANTNLRFRRTIFVVETLVSLGGLAGSIQLLAGVATPPISVLSPLGLSSWALPAGWLFLSVAVPSGLAAWLAWPLWPLDNNMPDLPVLAAGARAAFEGYINGGGHAPEA